MRFDVARGRVANSDGAIRRTALLAEHRSHRFADDVAAPEHDDFRAFGLHTGTHEQFHDARRGAGLEAGFIAEHELADIDGMKAIDVLRGKHA